MFGSSKRNLSFVILFGQIQPPRRCYQQAEEVHNKTCNQHPCGFRDAFTWYLFHLQIPEEEER